MYSVVVLSLENWQVLKMREHDPSYPNLHIMITDTESVKHALQLRGVKQMKGLHVENPLEQKRILQSEGVQNFDIVEVALEGARELHERFKAYRRKSLTSGLRIANRAPLSTNTERYYNQADGVIATKVSIKAPNSSLQSSQKARYWPIDLGPAAALSGRAKNVLTTLVEKSHFGSRNTSLAGHTACPRRPQALRHLRP